MPDAAVTYRKLPGRGGSALSSGTLWEAADHLLLVTASPVGESYRRFFFSDIQAIVIRRTARRAWFNVTYVILALLTGGPFIVFAQGSSAMITAGAIVGGFWLPFVLVNSLVGETCETCIQTAIQTERIPSLRRMRTALKVVARLQPRIIAAQSAAEPASPQPAA